MNEFMNKIMQKVDVFDSAVTNFYKSMSGQEVPFSFKEQVSAYGNNKKRYIANIEGAKFEEALKSLSNMIVHSSVLKGELKKPIQEDKKLAIDEILKLGAELKGYINSRTESFDYLNESEITHQSNNLESFHSRELIKEIEAIKEDHEKHDQRHQKLLADNLKRINEIEDKSLKMKNLVEDKLNETNKVYDETITRLEEKERNINALLGIVSGKKIAGKYEESAGEEKALANWLRYASIFCMALLVVVVGYSFWETTTSDFKWENSIFRVMLAFLLSVPAAYLARESAKHREQQYNHLQTSLDLNAIDPFIASLPQEQQNKIKSEIAGRIFASKDYSKVGQDSYPLNTHELLMELLKKVDFNGKKPNLPEAGKG